MRPARQQSDRPSAKSASPRSALSLKGGITAFTLGLGAAASAFASDCADADTAADAAHLIVAIGTSLTADGGWVERLPLSASDSDCVAVRAVNFGASAMTSAWGAEQIDRIVALEPDTVLIEFAINDAHLIKGFSRAEARRNVCTLVEGVRAGSPDAEIVLVSMNPVHGPRGWMRPRHDAFNDDYGPLAQELSVRWVDLRPIWRESGLDMRESIPDGVHPTSNAAARIMTKAGADCTSGSIRFFTQNGSI